MDVKLQPLFYWGPLNRNKLGGPQIMSRLFGEEINNFTYRDLNPDRPFGSLIVILNTLCQLVLSAY
jgi:hypothetical protein